MPLVPSPATARFAGALATAALAGLSLIAAPASAGSFEQVSRDTGANGFAPLAFATNGFGVGTGGRYSVLTTMSTDHPQALIGVRDIVKNTTTQIAKPGDRPLAFDRSETKLLVKRGNGLVIVPTAGVGAERAIPTGSGAVESASLSGDGNTIAFAREGETGLTLHTVSTGASRTVATQYPVTLGHRSLSDNGKVLAASSGYSSGIKIVGGVVSELPGPGVVSPDGKLIFSHDRTAEGYRQGLLATTVATGKTRKIAEPGEGGAAITWIAPDGSKAYFRDFTLKTYVVSTSTGRTTALAGPYGSSVGADLLEQFETRNGFSRDGRHAIITIGVTTVRHHAVVNVAGGDLPGDQEPMSATAYVFSSAPTIGCDGSELAISLASPGPWATPARSGRVTVTADGKPVVSNQALLPWGTEDDPGVRLPVGAKRVTVKLSVIDGAGRTLTHNETFSTLTFPWCSGG